MEAEILIDYLAVVVELDELNDIEGEMSSIHRLEIGSLINYVCFTILATKYYNEFLCRFLYCPWKLVYTVFIIILLN